MSSELFGVVYGLLSAASFGSGDFSGGFASRRANAFQVVILSQVVGLIFFTLAVILTQETIQNRENDIVWGMLAGVSGGIGLLALYRGLAVGRMGVVASLTAVMSAILPVGVSILTEGLPSNVQLLGMAIALVAVWLITRSSGEFRIQRQEVILSLVGSIGFGLFFIFIDRAQGGVFLPLVGARICSVGMILVIALVLRQSIRPTSIRQLPLLALAGVLDALGNVFFVLSANQGRLDSATVLSSLYPAVTVLLAWLILQERLTRTQMLGVPLAIGAVILIAL